jgi:hypothetical protein
MFSVMYQNVQSLLSCNNMAYSLHEHVVIMMHGMWRNEQLFRGSELEEPIILLNPDLDDDVIAFMFVDPIKASGNCMYHFN